VGKILLSTIRLREEASYLEAHGLRILNPPEAIASKEWIEENIKEADIMLLSNHDLERSTMEKATKLKLVVTTTSGYDHIDVEYAEERGICIANQPEAIAFSVAEHAIGMTIALTKNIVTGYNYVWNGLWDRYPRFLLGNLIRGKCASIVGMGRIGALISKYLRELGVGKILYYSRRRKPELEVLFMAEPSSLERIFTSCDIIYITLPLTKETENLITYDLLRKAKKGSIIVNLGRGKVLKLSNIIKLLEERSDVRLALDVMENEPFSDIGVLKGYKGRVLINPHIAGDSYESWNATLKMALRQIVDYVEKGMVWNPVTNACRGSHDIKDYWESFALA